MRQHTADPVRRGLPMGLAAALLGLVVFATGCANPRPTAAPQPAPAAAEPVPLAPANIEVGFAQAVTQATDRLIEQATQLDAFATGTTGAQAGPVTVVLDPMIDAVSSQQTETTRQMAAQVTAHLARHFAAAQVVPLRSGPLATARYLLTGTVTRALVGRPAGSLKINLALTHIASGRVRAQAWALTRSDGLDATPLRFDRDSPVLLNDRAVEGYITTSATGTGQLADAHYLSQLPAAAADAEGADLYNAGQYEQALAHFRSAGGAAGGASPRALAGGYLAAAQLRRGADALRAFGQIAAHGVASKALAVKFQFRPGAAAFPADPKVSTAQAMWVRQIARAAVASKACLAITGHTSRGAAQAGDDSLSYRRAEFIRKRLNAEARWRPTRAKAFGMGHRENIVGVGTGVSTESAADALDRRIEFRVVPCR